MKKLLAGLLGLSMLSMPMLQVSAIEYDENGNVNGDILKVIGIYNDDYYFLSNGCIIYSGEVREYIDDDVTLAYGDVVWIHADSIDPIQPGRYAGIREIEYLGKAEEYYGTTKELTITNINGNTLYLRDEQNMPYFFWLEVSEESSSYKSEFYVDDFHVGDKAIFVMNDDDIVLPLEFTYKAEVVNLNPVEETEWNEHGRQGMVTAINEDDSGWCKYYLDFGCGISSVEVKKYLGNDGTLNYGDIIRAKFTDVCPTEIGQICWDDDAEITYLGTAEEYYGNTRELTITNISGNTLYLEDEQNMSYSFYWYIPEYYRYKSEFYIDNFNIGDKAIFVMNDEDDVILPLEFTDKAEVDESINLNPVETKVIAGDANGDSEVDIIDVIAMNKVILGQKQFTAEQLKACDFNQNGMVDPDDSLLLMEYIVGLIDVLN